MRKGFRLLAGVLALFAVAACSTGTAVVMPDGTLPLVQASVWTSPEKTPVPHDEGMKLSLVLLSDLHINADHWGMADKLHAALQDIVSFDPVPDAIVLGGDLVDGGRERDYQKLREILSRYRLPPLYGLMGNHEYYDVWYDADGNWSSDTMPNGKTDAEARERFIRFMGYPDRPYNDVWIGDVHLIMLSQEVYQQEVPWVGEGAWYTDEQLHWLREVMKPHADGRLALVFVHQPLPFDDRDGYSHELMRAREFRSILAPYPNVIVFSGHNHIPLETPGRYVRDAAFHWFQNGSVGKSWQEGASVSNPSQGLYIQVYPDRVVVRGREFSNRTWIQGAEWTVWLR